MADQGRQSQLQSCKKSLCGSIVACPECVERRTVARICRWLRSQEAWDEIRPDTHELENVAEALETGLYREH